MGKLLAHLGDYAGSQNYYRQALAIDRKSLGEEHPLTAEAYIAVATSEATLGQYAAARADYERALGIYRRVLGDEHAEIATVYNNYGALLAELGDYAAARAAYEKALAIRRKALGENHAYTAASWENLGALASELGDYPTAQRYFEAALAIRRKTLGEEHEHLARSYSNLALLADLRGDYATSRDYLEKALAIQRRALGDSHPDTASSYERLALLWERLGDYRTSLANLDKALAIRRKVFGENHDLVANTHAHLGLLQQRFKDYPAARASLEKSLAIREKVLGPEHKQVALSLRGLADLDQVQGDYGSARKRYEQALAIFRKLFGEDYLETAATRGNLAVAQLGLGDFDAARENSLRLLEFAQKNLGEVHEAVPGAYENLAAIEAQQEHWADAVKWTDAERRASRRIALEQLPRLSEQEQLRFLEAKFRERASRALSLALQKKSDDALVAQAAGWLLNTKGIAQETLTQRALLAREAHHSQLAPLAAELQTVRANLAKLSLASTTGAKSAERNQKLAELTAREAALARQLVKGGAGAALATPWVELATVRKALPPDARLIEIAHFDRWKLDAISQEPEEARYLAFVMGNAEGLAPQCIDLGPARELDQLIDAWRAHIAQGPGADPERETELNARLTERLWKPLAAQVAGAKRLLLSPDGALWLAPWAALPIGEGQLLVEEFTISYLVSGRDLLAASPALKAGAPTIFADPDYDLSPQKTQEAAKAVLRGAYQPSGPAIAGQSRLGRAARLPGSAAEAKLIAPNLATLAGTPPVIYTDHYALESVVKVVQRPRITVFSTHGFFLPDQATRQDAKGKTLVAGHEQGRAQQATPEEPLQNPLVRCGLMFAGCNPRNAGDAGAGDDGILTGMEIVGIDFRGTELVVLSACDSGVGAVNTGEGVAGLRQAFQLAGAQDVVATLWQIPDRDSALIMNDFFANLAAGQPKAEALRNAQLQRIAKRREKTGAAPAFFWAAWTLTGAR
jgi:CHAT domain-containing protein/Tfp pilus assembly protein PilF